MYYVSDRSFRSRIGVPLICGKTVLAKCIVQDAHDTLGHGRDILQILSYILANFYITGVRKLVVNLKKSCPACLKLVKKSFTAFEADVPDVLKTIQPPFSYAQADIFGPIFAFSGEIQHKRWVLVVFCLSSRAVHLELLYSYNATSISRGFRRTFALRGAPRIIWIDAGINITRSGKDLVQEEIKVISALNLKFAAIEFKSTLPKHHAGIGAVERIIGSIKNTVSKSITGPNQLKMDDEELHTWLNMVIEKINDRPLILGAPLGITLTPNHIILGFRDNRGEEINPEVSVRQQINKWRIGLSLFGSLWTQEYTRRRLTVSCKKQDQVPKIGDIVLFVNEPCYKHELSAARVQSLLTRRNGDIFGASISYRREVGGRVITVNRHLSHLYPFMGVEKTQAEEQIGGLDEDAAAGVVPPGPADSTGESNPGTQRAEVEDEVSST